MANKKKAMSPCEVKGTIPDDIDAIISFFEENMSVDGLPKGRYGVECDAPDIETYCPDRLAARKYLKQILDAWYDEGFKDGIGYGKEAV